MMDSLDKLPFLTLGKYLDQDYLGIIGNSDQSLLSMYVFNHIHSDKLKAEFLRLGDVWWWETNRKVPINIALKQEWSIFRPYLKSFITKDFQIITGPCTSLDNMESKRIKRRQIQLIRKI